MLAEATRIINNTAWQTAGLRSLLQAEKQIARGRSDGDAVGAVGGGNSITARYPIRRR